MLRSTVLSLAGVLFGVLISLAYIQLKTEKAKPIKENIISKKDTPQNDPLNFTFLNPLVECSNFNKVYYDDMLGFREEIIDYVHSIIAKSNFEISFYFRDLITGSVVSHDEDVKFTPSSLMKVPVLVALLKESDIDPGLLDKKITYSKKMKLPFTNEHEFDYVDGKAYSMLELAEIMIGYSDNKATILIIDQLGLEKILKVQDDLRFGIMKEAGMYDRVISVKTYATIFRTLFNATYLSKSKSEQALEIMATSNYKEGIRKAVPSEIKVAQKFGIRQFEIPGEKVRKIEQLHQFGIVYRRGKPYLLGIMIKGDDLHQMQEVIYRVAKRVDQEVAERIQFIEERGIQADAR